MASESQNNDDLNNSIKTGKWFVCYYAHWCGYCKSMADDWEQLENKVRENKLTINIIKIEQTDITDPDITSYPTIRYINNGVSEKYTGERTTDEMYDFVKSKVICNDCMKMKR
jgi:thioredoxin domain-containing protein 5